MTGCLEGGYGPPQMEAFQRVAFKAPRGVPPSPHRDAGRDLHHPLPGRHPGGQGRGHSIRPRSQTNARLTTSGSPFHLLPGFPSRRPCHGRAREWWRYLSFSATLFMRPGREEDGKDRERAYIQETSITTDLSGAKFPRDGFGSTSSMSIRGQRRGQHPRSIPGSSPVARRPPEAYYQRPDLPGSRTSVRRGGAGPDDQPAVGAS